LWQTACLFSNNTAKFDRTDVGDTWLFPCLYSRNMASFASGGKIAGSKNFLCIKTKAY
jgi:hypothetical protein